MRTLPLTIISLVCICVIALSSSQAYGIPYISPPSKYFNSDIVLIGKVISSTPFSPDHTKYQIKVEQYLKNPQSQDTLTVIAPGTNKTAMTADTVFTVGQQAFLYLKKDQGNYTVWWYSYPTDSLCNPAPTTADLNFTYPQGAGLDYNPLQVRTSESSSYLYAVNQPVVIKYNAWNNQLTTKTFDVVFQVKNQTGQIILNDTKQVELASCIGHQIINSTFIPKVAGIYEIDVIFNNSLMGTTVEIPTSSVVNTVSNIIHTSPLQQFKSDVAAQDVKCVQNLQLVIKSEDGTPACVKPDTANKLVARGWGIIAVYPNSNPVTNIPYQGIDKPSGIVLIENQTYHMTTFNGTFDSIPSNGTNISFHNVLFTLLKPQQSNGNGDLFTVDAKFMNDNAAESLIIYPAGVGGTQPDKTFSNHTNPQAGFVVSGSTIKLLVSTDADSNTQTGMLDSSSPLKLYLSTSSQVIHPGQAIGITISINNTLSKPITLSDENSWKLDDLSINPCMIAPYGVAIFNGFYSEQNVTEGKPLGIFSNDALCPVYNKTSQNYVFQPSSGHHLPMIVNYDGYFKINETGHFTATLANGQTKYLTLCWNYGVHPRVRAMSDSGLGGPMFCPQKTSWFDDNKTAGIIQDEYCSPNSPAYDRYIAEVR